MPGAEYEPLSAQDRSFFLFETPTTPMHVGGIAVFETGPLCTADGGLDSGRVTKQIASKLHLMPRYRRRLDWTPLRRRPIWVDDEHFDLAYHVRHTSLPRPGHEDQLKTLAARILSQPLDRSRPLWELWLAEGLQEGRFAAIYKIHHSMVDGASGVNLLTLLFSFSADETLGSAPAWQPAPHPSALRLVADDSLQRVRSFVSFARSVAGALREPRRALRALAHGAEALVDVAGAGVHVPADTPLNQQIGRHRRIDWTAFDLARIRALRKKLDGTINDLVLTILSGALRRFLQARGAKLEGSDYRIVVPVNVRREGDDFSAANRVSAFLLSLPIDEPLPLRRFEYVCRETKRLKRSKAAEGITLFTDLADQTGSGLLIRLGVALANQLHPYNLIVSNVPGPQTPLWLLGARLRETYAQLPLFAHQGLGVVALSYDGRLFFTLVGDREVAPDLSQMTAALDESLRELEEAAKAS